MDVDGSHASLAQLKLSDWQLCLALDHRQDHVAVLCGGRDEQVNVVEWRVDVEEGCTLTPRPELALKGHTGWIRCLSSSPLSPSIWASAAEDKSIRVWDVAKGECLATFQTKCDGFTCAMHPNGRLVAGADGRRRNTLALWAIGGEEGPPSVCTSVTTPSSKPIRSIAFAPPFVGGSPPLIVCLCEEDCVAVYHTSAAPDSPPTHVFSIRPPTDDYSIGAWGLAISPHIQEDCCFVAVGVKDEVP